MLPISLVDRLLCWVYLICIQKTKIYYSFLAILTDNKIQNKGTKGFFKHKTLEQRSMKKFNGMNLESFWPLINFYNFLLKQKEITT